VSCPIFGDESGENGFERYEDSQHTDTNVYSRKMQIHVVTWQHWDLKLMFPFLPFYEALLYPSEPVSQKFAHSICLAIIGSSQIQAFLHTGHFFYQSIHKHTETHLGFQWQMLQHVFIRQNKKKSIQFLFKCSAFPSNLY
jgi:hypothetical protein